MSLRHRLIVAAGKHAPIKMPNPKVESGQGAVARMPEIIKRYGISKPLIVTDKVLVQAGLVKMCTDALDGAGVAYAVYDGVLPNPGTALVLEGKAMYLAEGCDGIIAFGGGSPMDCAKVIAAAAVSPKSIPQMEGIFQISGLKPPSLPPIIAIPTTAGTASECSLGAIITYEQEQRKLIIVDRGLLPKVAVLDPNVLAGLPPPITAATGMDALTHAVESFLSVWRQKDTKLLCLLAVEKIFKNLFECYENGQNLAAREEMGMAAFMAGRAMNRTYLGYVHGIAHQLGGLFHTPHGIANAMVLPHILDLYAERATPEIVDLFVELCFAAGLATRYKSYSAKEKKGLMWLFIQAVRDLHSKMNMPTHVPEMKRGDVQSVVTRALEESHGETLNNPGYATPVVLWDAELTQVVMKLLPPGEQPSKL